MFEKILQPKTSQERISDRKEQIIAELEKRDRECDQQIEDRDMSRGDFLKLFTTVVGAVVASRVIEKAELAYKLFAHTEKNNIVAPKENRVEEKEQNEENFNEEICYYGKEPDIQAMKDIFDFNAKGPIEINLKTISRLETYWKHRYTTKMKGDLVGAMKGIKPFIPRLKSIFAEYGVPEEYALLAIPESHWKLDAISLAGAEGPYQFMPDTGKDYGLMNSEDRRNPEKSAIACAKFLKKLYSRTNDWDLALSGYNGGYMKKYLKKCKREKQLPTYSHFLVFLTEKANKIKHKVRQRIFAKHKVAKGETFLGLEKEYGVSEKVILRHNRKIRNKQIIVGQVLKIPLNNAKKSEVFENEVRDISENLNYPPKFTAVYELVKNTMAWNMDSEKDKSV
jgi:hypothetical protein